MYTAVLFKWHHTTIGLACEQTLIWSVRGACGLRNFADVAHPPTCNYPVTSMSICVNNVIIPVKFWWCHIIIHLIVFSLPFFLPHRHARLGVNPENEVGRFPPPPPTPPFHLGTCSQATLGLISDSKWIAVVFWFFDLLVAVSLTYSDLLLCENAIIVT